MKNLGICRSCKKPLVYIYNTNVMVCQNPDCEVKGYRILDDRGVEIAKKIFKTEVEKKDVNK